MASQSRKNTGSRSFSGNHQRSWLWGHHAVTETMRAGKWPIYEIFATREASEQLAELLQTQSPSTVPVNVVSASRLEQLVRSTEHQGIVARLGAFPYIPVEQLMSKLHSANERTTHSNRSKQQPVAGLPPLVVVCDQIQDAFNFGAILRCCDGAAVWGVIVGDKRQAEVTPHVARSSSGAVNHVPIALTTDLIQATSKLKQLGLQVVAADSNAAKGIWESPLSEPTALIIGSEALGVRPELLSLSDRRVSIPMYGRVTSLNAAVASGILLYEIRRQQTCKLLNQQID